eukprot:2587646-Prymnesium_polylepis.1
MSSPTARARTRAKTRAAKAERREALSSPPKLQPASDDVPEPASEESSEEDVDSELPRIVEIDEENFSEA